MLHDEGSSPELRDWVLPKRKQGQKQPLRQWAPQQSKKPLLHALGFSAIMVGLYVVVDFFGVDEWMSGCVMC
jgi:hypothetical protein